MNRWLSGNLAALALGVTLSALAQGQPQIGSYVRPQVNPRPTVSPYVSIGRGGSGAINYYTVVRPQFDTQRQIGQLQRGFQEIQSNTTASEAGEPISTTGRNMGGFFNYSHYYPAFNRGGAGQVVPQMRR